MLVPLMTAVPLDEVNGPPLTAKMRSGIAGILKLLTVNGDRR